MFGFKKRRRKRIMQQPFPEHWQDTIQQKLPYVQQLPQAQQQALQPLIQIFIDEKSFEGCGGLQLTEEIKVIIAAQAAILILGIPDVMYPLLRSILVYPKNFYSKVNQTNSGGVVTEGQQNRSGESWSRGHVILSWSEVQQGMNYIEDGHNVVFHEFAHQLDETFEITKGVRSQNASLESLVALIMQEYRKLADQINRGQPTFFRSYGATNPAEFFAVATECFFEQSLAFKEKHPALFNQFCEFYKQDPTHYVADNIP